MAAGIVTITTSSTAITLLICALTLYVMHPVSCSLSMDITVPYNIHHTKLCFSGSSSSSALMHNIEKKQEEIQQHGSLIHNYEDGYTTSGGSTYTLLIVKMLIRAPGK
uniref:Uncharacterized protein n=1 Tax=Glossina palpalis gambiensis TaxID=67801 RepID=A0A1B0BWE5_9MUSC